MPEAHNSRGTTSGRRPTPAASMGLPAAGPARDLDDVVTHRGILCITGPDPVAVEEAIASCETAPGLVTTWVRADAPVDRASLVRALYTGIGLDRRRPRPRALADTEGLIAAELQRSTRLVIVPDAHMLRTPALQVLYGLWAHRVPNHFALVLAGSGHLDRVLQRPGLASLNSCVFIRHRLSAA